MKVDAETALTADGLLASAAAAADCARGRIDAAATDLFLPPRGRLSDRLRATMARLADALVAEIETDLRRLLLGLLPDVPDFPPPVVALLREGAPLAASILDRSRCLADPMLVRSLMRRAEEHHLAHRLITERAGIETPGPDPVTALPDHADPAVAAAANLLLVAEHRRFDRFQEPLLLREDLPAELAARLTWLVAAALRHRLSRLAGLSAAAVDRRIGAAAQASLRRYDEAATVEGRAVHLALLLADRQVLHDELILAALDQARLPLMAGALAVRSGLSYADAWDVAFDPALDRLAVMLRAIEMSRKAAAAILIRLELPSAIDVLEARIAAWEACDPHRAREALRPYRLDAGYRAAIADIASGLGGACGGVRS